MKKVLVLVGPTGVGKTNFSIDLAKHIDGEIISGDSIQVFKGFNIGSGKITEEEKQGIPHFCIDIMESKDTFSVADFQKIARKKIDEITSRENLPMIVGGTGLYVKACIYDYVFAEHPEISQDILDKYEKMNNLDLMDYLLTIDPDQARSIHLNNRKRLIRACIIHDVVSVTKTEQIESQEHKPIYDVLIIGCTLPREQLYEQINARVEKMVENGLIQEIENLLSSGVTFEDHAMQGIGYREWQEYFEGKKSKDEIIQDIQKHSRVFAKKQYTWFNNQTPIHWMDMGDEKSIEKTMTIIDKWRNNHE